jgi:hypothetical protein
VDEPVRAGQTFSFLPFSVQVVHKALKSLDQRKPAGPDVLDPCFLNLAADFIAEPLTYLFNLTLECNEIPENLEISICPNTFKRGRSKYLK